METTDESQRSIDDEARDFPDMFRIVEDERARRLMPTPWLESLLDEADDDGPFIEFTDERMAQWRPEFLARLPPVWDQAAEDE